MFIHSARRDTELAAFRAEVRAFLADAIAPELRRKLDLGQHVSRDETDDFLKKLGAKGWLTGKWPARHGGLGWGIEQHLAFREELGRAGTPWLVPFGITMVGPVIYTFGSDAQKARHLPGIRENTVWWCQGYSEPGSGSDLASLRTSAVRDGDHYVVNGQKTWTTLAHWADWMFCLVRTDPDAKKQEGISFLLIDIKSPGVTVQPIVTIDLGHHLNSVFFDDVRVPVENLVGEEGKGWTYAKFLLANERLNVAEVGMFRRYLDQLGHLLRVTREGGEPLSQSRRYRMKMAELEMKLATMDAMIRDQLAGVDAGGAPSMVGAAALKIRGSELQQEILETISDVLARHGLAYQMDAMIAGWNGELIGPEGAAGLLFEGLTRRAATIYGGSSEVQRGIIAKAALGM